MVRRIISSHEDYYNTTAILYRNLKNLRNFFRKLCPGYVNVRTLLSGDEKRGRCVPEHEAGVRSTAFVRKHITFLEYVCSFLLVKHPLRRRRRDEERRGREKSGRRDSNPRQPAWKAGGHVLAARLVYIGFPADFIRFTCNVSVTDKRGRARFLHLSANAKSDSI
jgi:hypothetical protein